MKKKQLMIFMSMLAPIAVLSACNQNDIEKQVQPQVKDETEQEQNQETVQSEGTATEKTPEELIKEKLDEQAKEIKDLTDEVVYYRDFVKELTATFTTEEMNLLIDNEWNYKLMINNINFPKNGVLELSDSTFDLVLEESRVPYSLISEEMSAKGKVQNNIIFEQSDQAEMKESTDKNITTFTYSFKDLPPKTTIKMEITDELMKELKLDTKLLQIIVQ